MNIDLTQDEVEVLIEALSDEIEIALNLAKDLDPIDDKVDYDDLVKQTTAWINLKVKLSRSISP